MDTITQVVLGAAVGEATLGNRQGNRAALWGAVGGLIPDLDILANPFLNEVARMSFHRSVTHSIVFTALMAPVLGYGVWRLYRRKRGMWRQWSVLMALALATHWLLDCFTTYGTQVFWPFTDYLVAWNSIFIIDPFYTVPFAASVVAILFMRSGSRTRRIVGTAGLALSTAYLALGVGTKLMAASAFEEAMERQGIGYTRYMTTPTPFNILLWSVVAETDSGYWTGAYSVLDEDTDVDFSFTPSDHALLDPVRDDPVVERIVWRARGYYTASERDGRILVSTLVFGALRGMAEEEGQSPFSYSIANDADSGEVAVERHRGAFRLPEGFFRSFIRRVLGEKSALSSLNAGNRRPYPG